MQLVNTSLDRLCERELLDEMIGSLSLEETMMALWRMAGLSWGQIGERLEVNPETARVRMVLCRARLSEKLPDLRPPPENQTVVKCPRCGKAKRARSCQRTTPDGEAARQPSLCRECETERRRMPCSEYGG
jgi:hypothetical protein